MEHHHTEPVETGSWLFPFSEYWQNHGHCVLYNPYIITFDTIGSLLTGLAYMLIPLLLYRAIIGMWQLLTLPAKSMILHLSLFIFCCGSTHFIDVWNWWHNDYHVSAVAKAITGGVSISFAYRLFFFIRNQDWKNSTEP
jgi:two-component system NtrC family sensor kinase